MSSSCHWLKRIKIEIETNAIHKKRLTLSSDVVENKMHLEVQFF